MSSPTVWPGHTCQLHYCKDRTAHTASGKWRLSDIWWFVAYAYPDGLGSFVGVLKADTKTGMSICMTLWNFLGQVNSDPFSEIIQATYGKNLHNFFLFVLIGNLGIRCAYGGRYQNKANRQHPKKTDVIRQPNTQSQQQAYLRDRTFTPLPHSVPCTVPGSGNTE